MFRNPFVRFTKQNVGGLLAGLGLGQLVAWLLASRGLIGKTIEPIVLIASLALIAIGGNLARFGQRKVAASATQQSQDESA